jgi:glycosyltransferase involved in cell wall biosynthesis
MQSHPLVSVLMTAYNREKYITEAIESVLASSYTNFELIIVDDGSKDKTLKIARNFEVKDSRVKVYINEKNLGDYPNRNKAASYAKGKYLKYLDSDDVIYKYSLSIMVEAMEKFPGASYAFTNFPNQDNRGPFPLLFTPEQSYFEHFFNGGFFYSGPAGTIILKSAFDEVGGFSGIRMIGDYELWLSLAAKYNVVKIQPNLIWWRIHEGQEFKIGSQTNMYVKQVFNIQLKALKRIECPLSEKLTKNAIKKCKRSQSRFIIKLYLTGNSKLGNDIFKFSGLRYSDLLMCLVPTSKK